MSDLRSAVEARQRPPGTSNLISGLVSGAGGAAAFVVGITIGRIASDDPDRAFLGGSDTGMAIAILGGLIGLLAGAVLVLVGVIRRLAGGPGRPVNTARAVAIGASIPGGLALIGLVLGVLL